MPQSTKGVQIKGGILFVLFLAFLPISPSAEEKVTLFTNGVEIQFGALTQIWGTVPFGMERRFAGRSEFSIRRSQLKFLGKTEGEKIGWELMIDPVARYLLQDAHIDLYYIPRLKFQAGQFKFPLSMENLTPDGELDFIERAVVVRAFADRRDIGAMLSGKYTAIEWQAGAFNGSLLNDFKDLVGRFVLKPVGGFQLGASGYWGKEYYGNFIKRQSNFDIIHLGGEIKIDYRNVGIRSEAIWEREDVPLIIYFNGSQREVIQHFYSWGGYFSTLYNLSKKHQLGTRLEVFDPVANSNFTRDYNFVITFGYTFFFAPYTKFQVNLQSNVTQVYLQENRDKYFVLTNLQIGF
ncbi:MAG: OprO/OprP family phosphate-selective porin [candidate division Zixibacteria bacterium]|nr:OprO/OprP family phosphate-selective porin [candidate division Zixibacteria bacterium]